MLTLYRFSHTLKLSLMTSLLALFMATSATTQASVCRDYRYLCDERDQLRPALEQIFIAARDDTLSLGEYLRLQEAYDSGLKVAEEMLQLGGGRGFYSNFIVPAGELIMRFGQNLPVGVTPMHLELNDEMARHSDQRFAEGQDLLAAEHYLRNKRANWYSYRRELLRSGDASEEEIKQMRAMILTLLMSQTMQCFYANHMTRIYSPHFDLSGYQHGDRLRECQASRYSAAKLLLHGVP